MRGHESPSPFTEPDGRRNEVGVLDQSSESDERLVEEVVRDFVLAMLAIEG